MRDCGLVDVREKPYKVPYIEDPKLPQAAVGSFHYQREPANFNIFADDIEAGWTTRDRTSVALVQTRGRHVFAGRTQ